MKINIKSILVFPFIFTFLAAAPINTHNNLFTGRQAASAEFTTVLHQLAVNVGLDGIPLMNFSPHSDYDRLCLAPLQDRLIIGHPTFMNNVNTVLARHPIPPDTSVSKRKELQRQLAHELQPYMKTVTSALHASMTEVQPLFTQKAQSVENALGGTSLSLEHIYALQVELMELRKLAIYSPEFMKTVSNLENKLLHPRPMEALTEIPYDHRPSQAAIHQPLYALRKPTRVPGHKPTQYTAVEILPTHTPHVISPKKSIQYVPLTNTLRRILDPLSLYLGTEAIRKQFWQRSNQLTQNEIDDVTPIILNEITWRGRDGDGRQVTITEEMMSNGVRDALAIGGRVLANFLKTTGARTIYTWEDPIGAIMALSRATRAAGVNSESLLATLTQSGVSSISVEQLGDETKGLLGLLLSAQSTAGINAQHLRKILGATRALNDPHGKLMEYAPIIAQELDGMQPDIALHLASTIQSINDHVNKNNIRSILRGMAMALSNCGQQKQFLHTVLSAAEDQINEDNAVAIAYNISEILKKFNSHNNGQVSDVGARGLSALLAIGQVSSELTTPIAGYQPDYFARYLVDLNHSIGSIESVTDEWALHVAASLQGGSEGYYQPNYEFNPTNFHLIFPTLKAACRASGPNAEFIPKIAWELAGAHIITFDQLGDWAILLADMTKHAHNQASHLRTIVGTIIRRTGIHSVEEARAIIIPWADALAATDEKADRISTIFFSQRVPSLTAANSATYAQAIASGFNSSGEAVNEYSSVYNAVYMLLTPENVQEVCQNIAAALIKAGTSRQHVRSFIDESAHLERDESQRGKLLTALLTRAAGDKGILAVFSDVTSHKAWSHDDSKPVLRDIFRLLENGKRYNTVKDLLLRYVEIFALTNGLIDFMGPDVKQHFYSDIRKLINAYLTGETTTAQAKLRMSTLAAQVLQQTFKQLLASYDIDNKSLEILIDKIMSDVELNRTVLNLASLGFRIERDNPQTASFLKETLHQMYLSHGNAAKLNMWVVTESPWNTAVHQQLLSQGYKPELFNAGYSKTLIASGQHVRPVDRMRDQTWQIYELAQNAHIRNIPERREGVGFDTFEEAEKFAHEYLVGHEKINQDQLRQILEETKVLQETLKTSDPTSQAIVTVELKKDYLEDTYCDVSGCFNPITGSHKEMPVQHALKANEMFLRVRDENNHVVANAVIVLTEHGAMIQKLYEHVNWKVYLHEAVFDALAELVRKQWVPAIIGTSDSAGIRAFAKSIPKTELQLHVPKILTDRYYSDLTHQVSDDNLTLSFNGHYHVLDRDALKSIGYKPFPEAIIPTSAPSTQNLAPAEKSSKAPTTDLKTEARKRLFSLGLTHIELGQILKQLDTLLDPNTDVSRFVKDNIKLKSGGIPDQKDLEKVIKTIVDLRQ